MEETPGEDEPCSHPMVVKRNVRWDGGVAAKANGRLMDRCETGVRADGSSPRGGKNQQSGSVE